MAAIFILCLALFGGLHEFGDSSSAEFVLLVIFAVQDAISID